MYIYYLHGKFQRGERLTPEEEKMLVDAFNRRNQMLEEERKDRRFGLVGTYVILGLIMAGVAFIGNCTNKAYTKLTEKPGTNYENKQSTIFQDIPSKERILFNDIYVWGERSKRLDNLFNFPHNLDAQCYTNEYNLLEQERLELKERIKSK